MRVDITIDVREYSEVIHRAIAKHIRAAVNDRADTLDSTRVIRNEHGDSVGTMGIRVTS
jgi:hypothetical protein